ncbi:MAG: aminopeptidase [Bdellovibrionota bacterium]
MAFLMRGLFSRPALTRKLALSLKAVGSVAFFFSLMGCSHMSYLIQAGVGQWSLYNRERPLDEVIRDPLTPSDVQERLRWIPEIKKRVEAELGVEATGNYTTYVDLKRPYVVWSITVAHPYAVQVREWKFPLVGSFPYLGFFKEETANEWAREYQQKGFDVYVRGVTAYSTLGYLRDPLLSSMLSKNKADMVNLIFHETTHGQIYVKGQGSFNEQVANYVGDYGERAWLVKNYGVDSAQVKAWENDRNDRRQFGIMLRAFAEELKGYYASLGQGGLAENEPTKPKPGIVGLTDSVVAANAVTSSGVSEETKERGKRERFAEFGRRLEAQEWKGKGFARASKIITNNAALLAFLTYEDEQHVFDLLDRKCAGDLKRALSYLVKFAGRWEELRAKAASSSNVAQDPKHLTPQAILFDQLKKENEVCG